MKEQRSEEMDQGVILYSLWPSAEFETVVFTPWPLARPYPLVSVKLIHWLSSPEALPYFIRREIKPIE